MKPIATVVLIVLTAFCHAECPIECFCDRVTTCTGNNLLDRFPKVFAGVDSSGYMSAPLTKNVPIRLQLHDFTVKHLSRQDFLQIISKLSEISISRNSLETFNNDTFSLEFVPSSSTSAVLPFSSSSSGSALISNDVGSENIRGKSGSASVSEEKWKALFSAERGGAMQVLQDKDISGSFSADKAASFLDLEILDLSQNRLKYFVGGGKLRRLKVLDLSSNMLQQVYELSAMHDLESINLRDNRISNLEANIFQNLRKLRYVNLDTNLLGLVHPSTFSHLPALTHLILSSNPISNLVPGFYWNSRVQFVDLSNVGLTSIPPSLTKTVRGFRCANNNLKIVRQTDFESYPILRLLDLDKNVIEIVEEDAFGRLDFLSKLSLNRNRLKSIPQKLPPSLCSLQLESNLIANLSSTDFKNLQRLEELNLQGNRISSLPPSVFTGLTNLKSLNLRSNLIDVIYRDSFTGLSKLETLDMSENPINVIVTGAFGMLTGVSFLHLSRFTEPIELDVSSFQPFENLRALELDESPHLARKLFEDGGFSHFSNLLELNLQKCELEKVNLVSSALVELNLQAVKMNGNPWNCQDFHGFTSVHELLSSRVVADSPTCASPLHLINKPLANLNFSLPKASLNVVSNQEKNGDFSTKSLVSSLTRRNNDIGTTDNFSNPLSSAVALSPLPVLDLTSVSPSAQSKTSTLLSLDHLKVSTEASAFDNLLESKNDLVPTQSYFEYTKSTSENAEENVEENSDIRGSGSVNDNSSENKIGTKESKGANSSTISTRPSERADYPPPRPMARKSSKRVGKQTRRPAGLKSFEQKTNDEKAVGDERLQKSGVEEEEKEKGAYQDTERIAFRASSELDNVDVLNPKYSYLKFIDNPKFQQRSDLPQKNNNSSAGSTETSVFVQALVISALTCVGSVLSLFFLSLAVYRYAYKRNTTLFSCNQPGSQKQGEDIQQQEARMLYTRFGRKKVKRRDAFSSAYDVRGISRSSSITSRPHHESGSDHIELSGIVDRLSFENEEIYHIT